MRVLVTGGAGYIGSHTLLELLSKDYLPFVVDNFTNSHPEALERVKRLSNRKFDYLDTSIADVATLTEVMEKFQPETVLHFAGLKAVGDSQKRPLIYYENNVFGTLNLLKSMDRVGCKKIIFSSSATVYGVPNYLPYDEDHTLAPINPYGRTKYFIEEILRDWAHTDKNKSAIFLRYFNPAGAHVSGDIGEDPLGTPDNLIPFVAQVAVGRRKALKIFGSNYDTIDGTGVRDYIHVSDLARGHVAALSYIKYKKGVDTFNLGTGKGYSVIEVLETYQRASNKEIPYVIATKRDGDLPIFFADSQKAKSHLGWSAEKNLEDICRDSWNWQNRNFNGYS